MAEKTKKNETGVEKEHGHPHECDDPGCGHGHSHDGHRHSHANPADETLQAKYYEFQIITEQMKQLQQQNTAIEEQNAELQLTLNGLNELESSKVGSKIQVPISSGIFAEAELKDKTNLLVSVGNNIIVKKTLSQTKEMIEERLAAVEVYKAEIDKNLAAYMKRAKELESELNTMLTSMRG